MSGRKVHKLRHGRIEGTHATIPPKTWCGRDPATVQLGVVPTCGTCLRLLEAFGIDIPAIAAEALTARDWPESPD